MAGQRKQQRAYELAKELGVPVKEFVAKLSENGVAIKSNFSVMDAEGELLARKLFGPLSGGLQKLRKEEEQKKADEAQKAEAAAAQARAREEAAKAAAAKAAAPAPAPAPHAARPAPARVTSTTAPRTPAQPRPSAPAKPAAPPKTSQKMLSLKGPQPATRPMPGLLSKPPPAAEPEAPAEAPALVSTSAPSIETAPADVTAAPAPAPKPVEPAPVSPPAHATPSPLAATAPSAPPAVQAAAPQAAPPPAPTPAPRLAPPSAPVSRPAPVLSSGPRPPQRPISGRADGRPPRRDERPGQRPPPQAAKPAPPQPPRLVYYGPSPAPADYEKQRVQMPPSRPTVIPAASGPSGGGPSIRSQSPGGIARPGAGRPGAPGARPAPGTAAPAPGQKTIFRFDEKEEERKRKERDKELQKEEERKRKDAQREAHKKKQESYQARQRAREESRHTPSMPISEPEPQLQQIRLEDSIVVTDLAKMMGKTPIEVVTKLIQMGTMASMNQRIDFDTASLVAHEFGFSAQMAEEETEANIEHEKPSDPVNMKPRPPIVTVMGHVDHGKTSLLDAIRESKVAEGEHGGITQHIGAYQVKLPDGHMVTFLDTPGHEAFTAMRAHGAKVTDCAILVVAADDGVMPQTEEAVNHAQAAGVPIIVAINKIDKPGANIEKVKQELTKLQLVPEEWGGKTIIVPVSATKRTNLQQLLEMIVLQSEMLELKADATKPARGVIIESQLDKGRGPVATVLVQEGTLRVGDTFAAGTAAGKVRALMDDMGRKVKEAGPGTPVNVMGFDSVPDVATTFTATENEAAARELVAKRQARKKTAKAAAGPHVSLEDLFAKVKEGGIKELKVIIKADVHGSVTALADSLSKVSNEEVSVNVIHGGVGAITETDVMFAAASDAIIIGFHVRPTPAVQKLADQEKVDIRLYNIIYEAVEEVEAAIKGMLAPKFQEVVFGHAEVRQAFSVPKIGKIAGSYVLDGKIVRNGDARVIRDGVEIYTGKIASLRRFKEDAKEVLQGHECGIGLERFSDVKEHDIIEVFKRQEIPRA